MSARAAGGAGPRPDAQERLAKALAEKEALLESTRAVLEENDFPVTARRIFDACCRLTGATSGYVALLNEQGDENEVLFLEAGGRPCSVDPLLPMPIRGLRAEAYRTGRAACDNAFAESRWMAYMPEGHVRLDNVLFAPLNLNGRTVGLLGMANKPGDFDEDDARIAEAFGELAAIALKNSRTRELLRKRDEELKEAQRLEAIGRLAGGVAHDFNNLLTPIVGFAEVALETTDPLDPRHGDLEEIQRAARSAKSLVAQLLAFGRKQLLALEVVDLGAVVGDFMAVLRRSLREEVAVELAPAAAPLGCRVDVSQLEQVLMNLAMNAQDAMPDGGRLGIALGRVELDPTSADLPADVRPGPYAAIALSDDGHGMDDATRARVFEPFFTTRRRGRGTGLGLATVFGIVKQHGGHIAVRSEPGQGTTFEVYFPLAERPAPAGPARDAGLEADAGTVLVVEDDRAVRLLAVRTLERRGYRVLEAVDGEAALDLSARHGGPIDLVIANAVMRGMTGPDLVRALRRERPGTRVLYMSDYGGEGFGGRGRLDEDAHFIPKPFSVRALCDVVDTVLAG